MIAGKGGLVPKRGQYRAYLLFLSLFLLLGTEAPAAEPTGTWKLISVERNSGGELPGDSGDYDPYENWDDAALMEADIQAGNLFKAECLESGAQKSVYYWQVVEGGNRGFWSVWVACEPDVGTYSRDGIWYNHHKIGIERYAWCEFSDPYYSWSLQNDEYVCLYSVDCQDEQAPYEDCLDQIGPAPTCSDGVQNYGETDIDTGPACTYPTLSGEWCGMDLNGDGYVDESTELMECVDGTCPVGAVECNMELTPPECPSPGSFNPDRNICESPPESISCPTGYTFDSSLDKCIADPMCASPGTFNATSSQCEVLSGSQCPDGYTYDATQDICRKVIDCAPGVFNASLDRCEMTPDWDCPSGYSYDAGSGQCTATPACPSGSTFNAAQDRCEEDSTASCPTGYTYDSGTDQCVRSAECPSPSVLNPSTDQCETPAIESCPSGYGMDSGNSICYQAPACTQGGTFDTALDICTLAVSGATCPAGYLYDSTLGQCVHAPMCSDGGYNTERDRCELAISRTCPSGYTYNSSRETCEVDPPCPAGSTYNATANRCEMSLQACPSGYIWDSGLDRCVDSAICGSGSVLDTATDQCVSEASPSCPTGYVYNATRDTCEASPSCISPGTYSVGSDLCITSSSGVSCPSGYTYSSTYGTCISSPGCGLEGTYNVSTDQCEAAASYSCPDTSYTYNVTRGRCEKSPVCSSGTYNPTYDKCLLSYSIDCPTGYVYESTRDRCEKDPACPADFVYSASTGKCQTMADVSYQCSLTGTEYSTSNQCTTYCSETATCYNELANLTGDMTTPPSSIWYGSGNRIITNGGKYIDFGPNITATAGEDSGKAFFSLVKMWGSGNQICIESCTNGRCTAQRDICVTLQGATASGNTGRPDGSWEGSWDTISYSVNKITLTDTYCAKRTRTGGCTQWGKKTGTVTIDTEPICPLEGGTCDTTGSCTVTGTCTELMTCPAGSTMVGPVCQTAATCTEGTLDTSAGVCQTAYTPMCPSGMVYDAVIDQCVKDADCLNGLLDSSIDQCFQNAASNCPSGYALSGGVCTRSPTCADGGVLNPVINECTYSATFECPTGYIYNSSASRCERQAECFSPGVLDGTVDQCLAGYSFSCPAGFTLSGTKCLDDPSCTSPGVYSSIFDKCDAGNDVCPAGFLLDSVNDTCQAGVSCASGGSLNGSIDKCQVAYGENCPSGTTLDSTNGVCQVGATCSPGGLLDGSIDQCAADATFECASGYGYDSSSGACTRSADCSTPGALNTTRDRCESSIITSCPAGGYTKDGNLCFTAPNCLTPGTYSFTDDLCASSVDKICSAGFSLDPSTQNCWISADCGSGYLDFSVDLCKSDAVVNCGSWSWDDSGQVCYSADVCSPGAYNALAGECQAVFTTDCETGPYVWNPDNLACEAPAECPQDPDYPLSNTIAFSPTINKCAADYDPACPTEYSYNGDPVNSCEASVFCTEGVFDPVLQMCDSRVCPIEPSLSCAQTSSEGPYTCSPNPCIELEGQILDEEPFDESAYQDDGEVDPTTGDCLGEFLIFNGKPMRCLKSGMETTFFNCCNEDEGQFLYLKEVCPDESVQTVQAKQAKRAHYIGTYCYKKIDLIGCVQRAKSYCVFNSSFARIVHEQGRVQLNEFLPDGNWGNAEAPNCEGFRPEEFQYIDFSQIDMSELFNDIIPASADEIFPTIQNNINEFQGYAQ